jgi:hypothetical protein
MQFDDAGSSKHACPGHQSDFVKTVDDEVDVSPPPVYGGCLSGCCCLGVNAGNAVRYDQRLKLDQRRKGEREREQRLEPTYVSTPHSPHQRAHTLYLPVGQYVGVCEKYNDHCEESLGKYYHIDKQTWCAYIHAINAVFRTKILRPYNQLQLAVGTPAYRPPTLFQDSGGMMDAVNRIQLGSQQGQTFVRDINDHLEQVCRDMNRKKIVGRSDSEGEGITVGEHVRAPLCFVLKPLIFGQAFGDVGGAGVMFSVNVVIDAS